MSAHAQAQAVDLGHGHGHGHGEHVEPHVLPVSVYIMVWLALVVLTALTVYVALFDFGSWNTVVALGVATVKGSLVALYFMHLRYDKKFNLILLLGGLMLVSIFFYPTLTDLSSRGAIEPIRAEQIGTIRNMPPSVTPPEAGAPATTPPPAPLH
jgi:cytochrome c oxidase subunit 4